MLTKPVTKNGLVRPASPEAREEEAQRKIARKHVERVRSFKFHLLAFLVAMPVITAIWALTEYMNADGVARALHVRRAPTGAEIDREVARLKARGS